MEEQIKNQPNQGNEIPDSPTQDNGLSEQVKQLKSQLNIANQRTKELETYRIKTEQAIQRTELFNKYVIDKENQTKINNFLEKYQIKDQANFIEDFYTNYLKTPDK